MAAAIKRLRGGPQALHVRHGSGGARAGEVRDVAYAWGGVAVGIRKRVERWKRGRLLGSYGKIMGKYGKNMGNYGKIMGKMGQ